LESARGTNKDSNFTVEWSFSGLGVQLNGGYMKDKLFQKLKELQQQFLFVSQSYSGQCDLRGAYAEFRENKFVIEELFKEGMDSNQVSVECAVLPCTDALLDSHFLHALQQNGITCAEGDNSVGDFIPQKKIFTMQSTHPWK